MMVVVVVVLEELARESACKVGESKGPGAAEVHEDCGKKTTG